MRRTLFLLLACAGLLPQGSRGGSVLWNVGLLERQAEGPIISGNSATYTFTISGFENGVETYPDIWIQTQLFLDCGIGYLSDPTSRGGVFVMGGKEASAAPAGDWAQVSNGTVVDFHSTRGASDPFFRDYGGESEVGNVLFVPQYGDHTVYLAFALPNSNPSAFGSGDIPQTIYGWAELQFDLFDVSLVRSAIDLSGRPLTVSGSTPSGQPVPEPSVAIMGLLGLGMMLKRRRA